MAQSPSLVQEKRPGGELLLRLAERAPAARGEWQVVVAHDRPLRLRLPNGTAAALPRHAFSDGATGLKVPRGVLAAGLLLSEEGPPPAARPLLDLGLPDPWAPRAFARLEVAQAGLVRVSGTWLAEHVPGDWPDPRTWTLVHNGRPEPMQAVGLEDGRFDPQDELVFWGAPSTPALPELGPDTWNDPWSAREVYFLASDGNPGSRFAQESGEIVETDPGIYAFPQSFPATLHLEEDNHFSRLTYVLDEPHPDHQFWTTGIYGGTLRTVTLATPGLDPYSLKPVGMRVCLRGLSAPADEGDPEVFQRLRLYVNDQGGGALEVGAAGDWRNQELRIASFGAEAFPDHSAFRDGDNTLYLAGVDEAPAGEFSSCMLDWIELDYQRAFRAQDGWLEFTADPELDGRVVNFEVTGFPAPEIRLFKLGRSQLRSAIVRPQAGGWRLRFQDRFTAGTRYVAAAESALREPAGGEAVVYHGLAARTVGATALVVVADSLMRAGAATLLAPVLDALEGGAVLASDRWIYDEFSHGRCRPHAIRDYVSRAWATWDRPPDFLLLVGDGVLAPRGTVPGREPVLPLMYEQVYKWGAASSDDWYARTATGSELPVLVSRWPAATAAELQNMAVKVAAYREAEAGPWCNSLLFTSGARAQDHGVFMALTEDLIRYHLPERHFIRRINAGDEGGAYPGSRPELLALLHQGQALVNYSGHGGGAVWEDNDLFSSDDVPQVDNAARLSFVTNATCFIASLDYQGALGRALLDAGPMGAIGVLGSTGLGFRDTGMELMADFYELVCANPGLPVAAALRESKQRLFLRHVLGREGSVEARQARAVMVMHTILGLPWQRLRLSATSAPTLADPVCAAGDSLHLAGEDGVPGSEGRVEIYSAASRPAQHGADFVNQVLQAPFTVGGDGRWQAVLAAPDSLPGGGAAASLRVWQPQGENGAAGAAWFYRADSLQQTLVWRAALLPEPPRPDQPFGVQVLVAGPQPPDSVAALLRAWRPGQDSLELRLPLAPAPGDPQRLVSAGQAGPWPDSTQVRLQFALYYPGRVDSTNWSWYHVLAPRPRLEWVWEGGLDERGRPLLALRNQGDGDADSLEVDWRRPGGVLLDQARLTPLVAGGDTRGALPLPNCRLGDTLRLVAAWDEHVGGPHPEPLDLVVDSAPLGADWREPAPGLRLRVADNSERCAVLRSLSAIDLENRQSTLRLDGPAWRLDWLDGGAPGAVEGRLARGGLDSVQVALDGLLVYHGEVALLLADPDGQVQLQRGDSLVAQFHLEGAAGLALGRLEDEDAPRIQLEAEGQVFADGGYVPPDGAFSWVLDDPSGIDPRPGRLALTLDGDSVQVVELALRQDEAGRATLRLALDEDLPRGQALRLELTCRDAAGNAATRATEFRLGERLALRYLGTYPNPFQRETRFVFSLTGVAAGVNIDIYTVAGRRIRRLEIPGPLINYVEALWDGRDRAGDVVANGVYFYRLTAQGPEGRVEATGKVARLK